MLPLFHNFHHFYHSWLIVVLIFFWHGWWLSISFTSLVNQIWQRRWVGSQWVSHTLGEVCGLYEIAGLGSPLYICCFWKVCESEVLLWSDVKAVSPLAHGITESVTSPAMMLAVIVWVARCSRPGSKALSLGETLNVHSSLSSNHMAHFEWGCSSFWLMAGSWCEAWNQPSWLRFFWLNSKEHSVLLRVGAAPDFSSEDLHAFDLLYMAVCLPVTTHHWNHWLFSTMLGSCFQSN